MVETSDRQTFQAGVGAQQLETGELFVNQSQAGPSLCGEQWLAAIPPDTSGPDSVVF